VILRVVQGGVVTRDMMTDDPHDQMLEPEADEIQDRRRPNRREVSEELIPLLRDTIGGGSFVLDETRPPDIDEGRPSDDLSAARGVIVSTFVGMLIWIGIGLVAFALLR
jgi:hypothetical protein